MTGPARIRARIAQLRTELMDAWTAPEFDFVRAADLQAKIHRLLSELRRMEGQS